MEGIASQFELGPYVPPFSWTEENVERMRSLIADGHSAAEIAADLGCSRNAVIGKWHRLGMCSTTHTTPKRPKEPKEPRPRIFQKRSKITGAILSSLKLPELAIEPNDDDLIPLAQRRTLIELTPSTCRWPVGEVRSRDFFFCGAAAVPDHPYCIAHCLRAYSAADQR